MNKLAFLEGYLQKQAASENLKEPIYQDGVAVPGTSGTGEKKTPVAPRPVMRVPSTPDVVKGLEQSIGSASEKKETVNPYYADGEKQVAAISGKR